jgi:two-component system nitrogen regulation sensor histidine kinase NtrY
MDAPAAESDLTATPNGNWFVRQRKGGRLYRYALIIVLAILIATAAFSYLILKQPAQPGTLISPPLIAVLLIANLIPAIVLMVLLSRGIAMHRAQKTGLGSGRLHTRLVALFSVVAAVPTVLVAIFASLLFQSGLEFWFSDQARTVLAQAENTSRIYDEEHRDRIRADLRAMGIDMVDALNKADITDPSLEDYFYKQVAIRGIKEASLLKIGPNHQWQELLTVNFDNRPILRTFEPSKTSSLVPGEVSVKIATPDRVEGLIKLDQAQQVFLYGSRQINERAVQALSEASAAASEYSKMLTRGRSLQLRFNAALLLGSLVIVGFAIFAALRLADRLVRPVGQLAAAAGRIEQGDFSARVPVTKTEDEIQTLATAFNRMTARIDEQTGELRSANSQLETRRAFIEAVLSSVTAGIVAVDTKNDILLINRSAEALLQHGEEGLEGLPLGDVSPDLDDFIHGDEREANVDVETGRGRRTLAIKRVRYQDGSVLTFDDITDQLSDQRTAAWSDIARRIAHEIKNPLTPIQLAAERLQRRFGTEVESDQETFERLTGTIVRQVGDLRRMVDEFSNFARMPKPVFRDENVHEIARHALFLHEVAHPGIKFVLEPATGDFPMVCDRRQLGQALTNIVKNGVEAIESRRARGEHHFGGDRVELRLHREGDQLVIDISDTGVGLPENRERLTEPYMTTRVRGTGLGLAIVKKIVEEHCGEIAFLDQQGGGTRVRIAFDADKLAQREGEKPSAEAEADEDGNETDV